MRLALDKASYTTTQKHLKQIFMTRYMFITSLLVSLFEFGFAQEQPCSHLRADTLTASMVPSEQLFDAVKIDVEAMVDCLELDSIDRLILTTPALSTLITVQAMQGEVLRYGPLLDSIQKFKNLPEYSDMKSFTLFMAKNENEYLRKEGWQFIEPMLAKAFNDKKKLLQAQEKFESLIVENITYRMFLTDILTEDKPVQNASKSESTSPFEIFQEMKPLETMLKKSEDNQKPLLLYFSGWGSVNARKMEDSWFGEDVFKVIEKNFTPFIGYADDRSAITDELRKEWNGDTDVKTLGKCIRVFQKELVSFESQPFFVIVSLEGQVLATQGYTLNIEEFKNFLNTKID